MINRAYFIKSAWNSIKTLLYPRNWNRAYWHNYFEKAATRRTSWKVFQFTGWKEAPNDLHLHAQVIGISHTDEQFYTAGTIIYPNTLSSGELESRKLSKQRSLLDHLDSYLDPECRCKLGPHWQCSKHFTWEG